MSGRTSVFREARARMFRLPGMITCARAEELIDDFCEGGLAAGERRRAYVHFRVCPDCRSYLAAYRRTIELGKAVFEHPDAQAAPEVSEKLAQSVLESAGKST